MTDMHTIFAVKCPKCKGNKVSATKRGDIWYCYDCDKDFPVVFAIVAGTTILRFYDKISPDVTGLIFGFILGTILGILGSLQKDLLKNGK